MLRGNFISGIASFAIMSSVDFVDIFRGRISGEQLVKNLADTASSVAGGGAGWIAGAAVGSVAGPIGMIVGGFWVLLQEEQLPAKLVNMLPRKSY